ncbi:hypothetical protein [Nitratifractor sp.]
MELWHVVALSLLFEMVEAAWQYSLSFEGTMRKIYALYRRSVFLLLLGHTGYLYLLYVSLRYDLLDWPIVVAIALKTLDIFTKIEMVRRLYVRREPPDEALSSLLGMEIPLWLWLIGPLTYPWLLYLAFLYR